MEMSNDKVFSRTEIEGQCLVEFGQYASGRLYVKYGQQLKIFDEHETWKALAEQESCVAHALTCAGVLD